MTSVSDNGFISAATFGVGGSQPYRPPTVPLALTFSMRKRGAFFTKKEEITKYHWKTNKKCTKTFWVSWTQLSEAGSVSTRVL